MINTALKTIAIIQARMGSSRLPGKVLMDLAGKTVLERVVDRVHRSRSLDNIIVATSVDKGDNPIAELCIEKNWTYSRGSEDDVLDRFCQACLENEAEVVVRITADCPLVDPAIIDEVVSQFLVNYPNLDYVSNTLPTSYPRGLDVEVFTEAILAREGVVRKKHRQHVTQGIRRSITYRKANVISPVKLDHMRWTLDTAEDLEFMRKVFHHFRNYEYTTFGWLAVVALLQEHPDWIIIDTQKEPG